VLQIPTHILRVAIAKAPDIDAVAHE
jgi:hypothetical protein